jgi:hypothetical protein
MAHPLESGSSITALPPDIAALVLTYLDAASLAACEASSSGLRAAARARGGGWAHVLRAHVPTGVGLEAASAGSASAVVRVSGTRGGGASGAACRAVVLGRARARCAVAAAIAAAATAQVRRSPVVAARTRVGTALLAARFLFYVSLPVSVFVWLLLFALRADGTIATSYYGVFGVLLAPLVPLALDGVCALSVHLRGFGSPGSSCAGIDTLRGSPWRAVTASRSARRRIASFGYVVAVLALVSAWLLLLAARAEGDFSGSWLAACGPLFVLHAMGLCCLNFLSGGMTGFRERCCVSGLMTAAASLVTLTTSAAVAAAGDGGPPSLRLALTPVWALAVAAACVGICVIPHHHYRRWRRGLPPHCDEIALTAALVAAGSLVLATLLKVVARVEGRELSWVSATAPALVALGATAIAGAWLASCWWQCARNRARNDAEDVTPSDTSIEALRRQLDEATHGWRNANAVPSDGAGGGAGAVVALELGELQQGPRRDLLELEEPQRLDVNQGCLLPRDDVRWDNPDGTADLLFD